MGMRKQGSKKNESTLQGVGGRKPRSRMHHNQPKLQQVRRCQGQIFPENANECTSDASEDR